MKDGITLITALMNDNLFIYKYFQMKIKPFRKVPTSMEKDETCKMDVAVLIAFPCIFLLFNIVYWLAFSLYSENIKSESNRKV